MHTDTVGQEKYRAMAPMLYRNAHVAALGFDVTHRDSMDACDYWAREIRGSGVECLLVAVGNKIDLAHERQISTEEARAHFEEKGVPYFETSAKTGEGVNEFFEAMVRLALERHLPSLMADVNNNSKVADDEVVLRKRRDDKCTIC